MSDIHFAPPSVMVTPYCFRCQGIGKRCIRSSRIDPASTWGARIYHDKWIKCSRCKGTGLLSFPVRIPRTEMLRLVSDRLAELTFQQLLDISYPLRAYYQQHEGTVGMTPEQVDAVNVADEKELRDILQALAVEVEPTDG